jgi:aryl-alcohol dehydrogenase-like predicted oxidoreductase
MLSQALHPIGLGCMPMSTSPGRDEQRSIRTVHAALDAGVDLLDTADAYALDEAEFGHNEALVARALAGHERGGEVLVATKGGHVRRGEEWLLDGRPDHLRSACEASLRRLGVEAIDLYQLHRPDPDVPFAESVGALHELRDEGKVRHVGLSNVNVEQLDEARGIVEVAAVQNQLSLAYPQPWRNGEVAACAGHGIVFLAWSPLGGAGAARETAAGVGPVREAAERRGVSPQRVALAWLMSLADVVMPIPGASRPESIADSAQAGTLELDQAELEAIGAETST